MKKAKKANPLFLLDEIDKLGADFRGDPSSALLEVLDPEQNNAFNDHYLEVDYDLSNVMFVTTANTLNIPAPLMDRMEIIRIAGYTEDEKVEIARRHLIPKQVKANGLKEDEWSIDDGALKDMIQRYTREAGVRNLERELAKLTRKAVKDILTTKKTKIKVTEKNLEEYLGVPKFRFGEAESEDQVGVVTGLAWTEVGGELLTIEGVMMPGKGKMTVTGNLRDVMKESISAANSYVKSRAVEFGIEPPLFEKKDIHVHVPEGRDAEGRAVGRCRHGDGDHFDHDRHSGAARRRHDRRDHPAWPGAADRRIEGEASGGAQRRHQEGSDPRGERQGPGGDSRQRQKRTGDRSGVNG